MLLPYTLNQPVPRVSDFLVVVVADCNRTIRLAGIGNEQVVGCDSQDLLPFPGPCYGITSNRVEPPCSKNFGFVTQPFDDAAFDFRFGQRADFSRPETTVEAQSDEDTFKRRGVLPEDADLTHGEGAFLDFARNLGCQPLNLDAWEEVVGRQLPLHVG